VPLTDAEKALTDLGHPGSRLRTDYYVRSPTLRTALLTLWDLYPPQPTGDRLRNRVRAGTPVVELSPQSSRIPRLTTSTLLSTGRPDPSHTLAR